VKPPARDSLVAPGTVTVSWTPKFGQVVKVENCS
jgi:hypothetical protein